MKILVFSDSHGNNLNIIKAIKAHGDTVDYVFFLGDGIREFWNLKDSFKNTVFVGVRGNCDFDADFKDEVILDISGVRFLLCHGHKYSVKRTLLKLDCYALENSVDVALFGHTHVRHNEYIPPSDIRKKGLYLFNPGTVSRGFMNDNSFGVIEITKNSEVILSHGMISNL